MVFGFRLPFRRPRPSTIRPLRADAAEACASIHKTGFAHPWSGEEFASPAGEPRRRSLPPRSTPPPAACAASLCRGSPPTKRRFLTVAVDPALRGHGVGRDLMREHLARAALSGARAIFLKVDPDDPAAVALYRRFGFRDVGRRDGYYRRTEGRSAAAIVMRRISRERRRDPILPREAGRGLREARWKGRRFQSSPPRRRNRVDDAGNRITTRSWGLPLHRAHARSPSPRFAVQTGEMGNICSET